MDKEYSSMVLLMVLHVLAKQGKIDPKKFIEDYKTESHRFIEDFAGASPVDGINHADRALGMFEDLITHNLPLPFDDTPKPPQKPPPR